MDHWHAPYLGLRHIPPELNTFFTFSAKERALIDDRRRDLYRLALALHLGFVRMTGRTLDAYRQIPKALWVKFQSARTNRNIRKQRKRSGNWHKRIHSKTRHSGRVWRTRG